MRVLLLATALAATLLLPLSAQTTDQSQSSGQSQTSTGQTSQTTGSAQKGSGSSAEPVPYSPDEFPLWLRDVRRAEVVTIGAFPIAVLVSSITLQTIWYAQSGFSQDHAPAIFGAGPTQLTNQQKIGILLGGAGLSVVVALIDFALGRIEDSSSASPPR